MTEPTYFDKINEIYFGGNLESVGRVTIPILKTRKGDGIELGDDCSLSLLLPRHFSLSRTGGLAWEFSEPATVELWCAKEYPDAAFGPSRVGVMRVVLWAGSGRISLIGEADVSPAQDGSDVVEFQVDLNFSDCRFS